MSNRRKRTLKRRAVKAGENAILAVGEALASFAWWFLVSVIQACFRWPKFGLCVLVLVVLSALSHHPVVLGITVFVVVSGLWMIGHSSHETDSGEA